MEKQTRQAHQHGIGRILLEFLGSMNLAITVLVAIAIAAVIGTVLQQNQAYSAYQIKFGPFWFDVFKTLGLFDVYKAWWFLALLGFLLLSTSVCIYRNGPTMLREMRQYRLNAKRNSLRTMHHAVDWQVRPSIKEVSSTVSELLSSQRYRVRSKQHDDHLIIAAMKGASNRLGYLFTHIAIVVICIGALLDGNLPLKIAEMRGQIEIETRDIVASQVPKQSVIGVDNPSFRGSVNVAEGGSASIVFLNMRDGYLVQELPFRIELKDFRIEHYPTGQPKSFESDLVIHDDDLAEPLAKTIAVNHPLIYKGYAIYQASFSDGGSKLKMRMWPLFDSELEQLELNGEVNGNITVSSPRGPLTIELTDFRLFNINPVENEQGKIEQKNYGPSFSFKLRDDTGQANEFINYMSPVDLEGRLFLMSGVRNSPSEEFRYLHIPADEQGSPQRFMRIRARLLDDAFVRKMAEQTVDSLLQSMPDTQKAVRADLVETVVRTTYLFTDGGNAALVEHIEKNIPEDKRQVAGSAYFNMLRAMLSNVYLEVLKEEGHELAGGVNDRQSQFFEDSWNALSRIYEYDSPFYLQLQNFEHIQASGLQITRSPGKNTVYLGCVMLILGVFMMFYIPQRRYWAWLRQTDAGTEIVFAGMGNRHERELAIEFEAMQQELAKRLGKKAD
ncbi:MAG: cytochrome c biogenesis protein ResB [Granulosicoccaceae bacterium]